MANEQVLSDFKAPSFNGTIAQRVLSNEVVQNLYQGLIESDGKGVTTRFTYDTSGAEIRIPHIKPIKAFARRLGAAVNGGNFPIKAYEGETDAFGLRVLDISDAPIDLARVTKEMIPVDLAAAYIKSYTDQTVALINAATIAGKFYATTVKEASGGEVNITKYAENDDMLDTVIKTNTKLNKGVKEMGVAMFPTKDRCFTIQTDYESVLLIKGVLSVGGANYGYDIVKNGTVSAGATPNREGEGYIGHIVGVPCHSVAPLYYELAAQYLGLTESDVEQAIGCISSGFANVRGIASADSIKVIDHPDGQGTRFQPFTRWGFSVLPGYEKGNSFIVKSDYVNSYESLYQLFGLTDFKLFEVIPAGSRISLGASVVSNSATSFTVTCPNAYKIAYVLDADNSIDSVAKFYTKYKAADKNSSSNVVVSGETVTGSSLAKGKVIKVLCMAADGTCELTSHTM